MAAGAGPEAKGWSRATLSLQGCLTQEPKGCKAQLQPPQGPQTQMSPGDTTARARGQNGVPRQSHKVTEPRSVPGAHPSPEREGSGQAGDPTVAKGSFRDAPGQLTSPGPGLVGDPWEPEMREKGLRGLVRLAELRGLAGLLELYVPEGPMATAEKSRSKCVHRGFHLGAAACLEAAQGCPKAAARWGLGWARAGTDPAHLCAWQCPYRGTGCSSSAPPSRPGSARSPSGSAG